MSGIAGIYNLDGQPVEPHLLTRMTDAIAHRGPDGVGHWINGSVGLGHRMLHTTPESLHERQPLTDESGQLCLTLDGRVDNREELRAALLDKGFRLRDDTDAELVLRAYECWGTESPRHIIGDFAYVIWDGRERQLFCARDTFGVRSLCYYSDGRKILIGSELRQFFEDESVRHDPNEGMIAEYLAAQIVSKEETLYQNIWRLPPAYYLIVRDGKIKKGVYWDLAQIRDVRYQTDEEYVEHFQQLLAEAISCRLRCNGRVGATLSGGLDSSAVVAMTDLLRRTGGAALPDFETFSLVFPGWDCDETSYIQDTVERLGLKANFIYPDYADHALPNYVESVCRHHDFPDYPNAMMWRRLLAKARGSGFRVLLTGLGGDEWFCGSPDHSADLLRRGKVFDLIRQARCDAVVFEELKPWRLIWRHGIKPLVPAFALSAYRHARGRSMIPAWIEPEFALRTGLEERLNAAIVRPLVESYAQRDILNWATSGWQVHAMERGNRLDSQVAPEMRHPLHDRRIIQFGFGLPERQRWRQVQTKFLLRQVTRESLPDSVRTRINTKANFSRVTVEALKITTATQSISSLNIFKRGWVIAERVGQMWEQMLLRSSQNILNQTWHTWPLFMVRGIDLLADQNFL